MLTVIMADPGEGKTAKLMDKMCEAVKAGHKIQYVGADTVARMVERSDGKLVREDFVYIDKWATVDVPIFIDDFTDTIRVGAIKSENFGRKIWRYIEEAFTNEREVYLTDCDILERALHNHIVESARYAHILALERREI